jgi:hypothetical protein
MGTRLQELEAEVAQIQLIIQIFLRHLLSLDQQDLILEDFCSSFGQLFYTLLIFWATCRLFSFVPIVLNFRTFLFVDFIYSVYPCPDETSRGSILLL